MFCLGVFSSADFERIASTRCPRWSQRSLAAVRRVLVDDAKALEISAEMGMLPQQVNVLRDRFLHRAAAKVTAFEFMRSVQPDHMLMPATLKPEVRVLVSNGYSPRQVSAYLRKNDVDIPVNDIRELWENLK